MLTLNQVKEQLSYAFVHAVASRAGFICGHQPGPDMDSIDVNISALGRLSTESLLCSPNLDLQL